MVGVRHSIAVWILIGVTSDIGINEVWAGEGHGGGAGHAVGEVRGGWNGCRPGFWGCRYPGWCGPGLGWGFGGAYWYGYPYYPYYWYGYGYPVFVDPFCAAQPTAHPQDGAATSQDQTNNAQSSSSSAPPARLTDLDVMLTVRVPPDALVWINGVATTQTGPRREFVSSGLAAGRTYTYVAAKWTGPNGQAVELERRVAVQGGERRNVDFIQAPPSSLTVQVP
jgi:uncharacterized protein (TIGR03000 family)